MPLVPGLVFLLYFFCYPVGQLLWLSFTTRAGAFATDQYVRLFTSPLYLTVMANTFKISLLVAVLCVLLGYPVAYYLANATPQRRAQLIIWVLVPFWTSFLVRAFAWMVLLAHNGPITNVVNWALGADPPVKLLYNFFGTMVGTTQALLPMAILVMTSVMQGIDTNLVKAAATLGGRPGQGFWRIYFPLSFPGVAAAGLLTFITSLGFFITPALLGSPRETMIAQMILTQVQELLNWRFAGAISLLLLVLALIVFALYDRLTGLSDSGAAERTAGRRRGLISGIAASLGGLLLSALGRLSDVVALAAERLVPPRGDRPRRQLGGMVLKLVVGLMLVFLVAPALVVIPVSFTGGAFIELPPAGFSLRWYQAYLGSSVWVGATIVSLVVGVVAGLLTTIIGTAAAFVLVRARFFGKQAVLALFLAPLIIPRIIIAVALFYLFARLGLVGTAAALVIGHTVLALPFVVVTVMSVLKSYDDRYDQAALTLGATPARTLRHVTLPLISPGIIAAFLFGFVTSFDELTIALFVSAGTVTTLPKMMWSDLILQVNPTLAAVSSVILVLASAIVLGAEAIRRRQAATR